MARRWRMPCSACMHALGHDDMDAFGDSTGAMSLTMPMSAMPAQG